MTEQQVMSREEAILAAAIITAVSFGVTVTGWMLGVDWITLVGGLVSMFGGFMLLWNLVCATIEWWWWR